MRERRRWRPEDVLMISDIALLSMRERKNLKSLPLVFTLPLKRKTFSEKEMSTTEGTSTNQRDNARKPLMVIVLG